MHSWVLPHLSKGHAGRQTTKRAQHAGTVSLALRRAGVLLIRGGGQYKERQLLRLLSRCRMRLCSTDHTARHSRRGVDGQRALAHAAAAPGAMGPLAPKTLSSTARERIQGSAPLRLPLPRLGAAGTLAPDSLFSRVGTPLSGQRTLAPAAAAPGRRRRCGHGRARRGDRGDRRVRQRQDVDALLREAALRFGRAAHTVPLERFALCAGVVHDAARTGLPHFHNFHAATHAHMHGACASCSSCRQRAGAPTGLIWASSAHQCSLLMRL